jgi:methylmalonyl-CoA mutase cobalamin-binding subunit
VGGRFFTEALAVRKGHCRTPSDVLHAAVGTAVHGIGVATARLRYSDTYSRLRRKASL